MRGGESILKGLRDKNHNLRPTGVRSFTCTFVHLRGRRIMCIVRLHSFAYISRYLALRSGKATMPNVSPLLVMSIFCCSM